MRPRPNLARIMKQVVLGRDTLWNVARNQARTASVGTTWCSCGQNGHGLMRGCYLEIVA